MDPAIDGVLWLLTITLVVVSGIAIVILLAIRRFTVGMLFVVTSLAALLLGLVVVLARGT